MRVLLDENVDRRLKRLFDDEFEVETVTERGWSGKSNSELLRMAEQEFDGHTIREKTDLSEVELDKLLDARKMTKPWTRPLPRR
jgi:hypothetical protein